MSTAHNIVGPNSPIQTEFLECPAYEAGYFGGKKGGKTTCVVLLPLAYVQDPRFRCLIVRRERPDLAYIEEVANAVFKRACPGVIYNMTSKVFTFPHPTRDDEGAKVHLTFCRVPADYDKKQGWKLSMLVFDEITQWPDDRVYTTLAGELLAENDEETGKPWMQVKLRCTSNPMGRGSSWVRKRFCIDKFPEGKDALTGKRVYMKDERTGLYRAYFKSTVFDNPAIDPSYIATLKNQSDLRQRAMIYGDWVEESSAFVEFDRAKHVVDAFDVPRHWELVLSGDWGYSTWALFHLWAINPDNRGIVGIAEWKLSRTHPAKCAELIRERIEAMGYSLDDLDDARIGGDAFSADRDGTGLSPAEHMIAAGIPWRPVDRSRELRFQAMVNRLTTDVEVPDGRRVASWRIMRGRMPELEETLPLLPKKEGEDDIDKNECKKANDQKGNDHAYDSATHMLMGEQPIEQLPLEERDEALWRRERMPRLDDLRPYQVGIPQGY